MLKVSGALHAVRRYTEVLGTGARYFSVWFTLLQPVLGIESGTYEMVRLIHSAMETLYCIVINLHFVNLKQ